MKSYASFPNWISGQMTQCFHFHIFSCREQLQQQHTDFMATRRELAHVNRENERFQREHEEFRAIVEVNRYTESVLGC